MLVTNLLQHSFIEVCDGAHDSVRALNGCVHLRDVVNYLLFFGLIVLSAHSKYLSLITFFEILNDTVFDTFSEIKVRCYAKPASSDKWTRCRIFTGHHTFKKSLLLLLL